ncbi:hypothetical protein FRC02_009339 [Tulasnella sp. 418]|nr:hypothetical protein FRC02_009339 [Tulasnella sp. 418]
MVSTRGKHITYNEDLPIEDIDDSEDQEEAPAPKRRKKMTKEDYCYTSKIKRKKGKGKEVEEVVKPRPTGKGRRLLGKLADLMNMPIEIFAEICSHLYPVDLLHLARSSKRLRAILMTEDSVSIWRTSRKNQVNGLPDCPDDLSEPQYAALVFTTVCQGCTGLRAVRVHYGLRTRHCIRCYPDHIIKEEKISTLNLSMIKLTNVRLVAPSVKAIEPGKTFGSEYTWYSIATLKALDEKWASAGDADAQKSFMDAQIAITNEIAKNAAELNKWQYKEDCKNAVEGQDIRAARMASIKKKLMELGWESKDFPRNRSTEEDREWHHLLDRRQALSEKIWENLKPRLLEILEITKARRLESEATRQRLERRDGRRKALEKFYKSLKDDHREEQFDIFFPEWGTEAMSLDPIKELLEDDERSTVTRDRWDTKKHIVLDELKILTAGIERKLAQWYSSCLANVQPSGTTVAPSITHHFLDGEPMGSLTGSGPLVDMRSPTAVFTCSHCEEPLWFPSCFLHPHFRSSNIKLDTPEEWDYKSGPFRTRFIPSLPFLVLNLLQEMNMDHRSMTTLDVPITMRDALSSEPASEARYLCLLCDPQMRQPLSFAHLVLHIHEEQEEFGRAKRDIEGKGREAFEHLGKSHSIPLYINDHGLSEERMPGLVVSEVTSEEALELRNQQSDFKTECESYQGRDFHSIVSKYWKGGGCAVTCRLCPSSVLRKWVMVHWAVVHLRAKHGVDIPGKIAQKQQDLEKKLARAALKAANHQIFAETDNDYLETASIDGDLLVGYEYGGDEGDSD